MDILLVEDSDIVRREIESLLRSLPQVIDVTGKRSVSEARAAIDNGSYDIWILDFELGDGTAIDLLEVCSQDGTSSHPTIVVVTNHATPEVRARCLRAGADLFFDKSNELDELASAVEAAAETPSPSS